MRYALNNKGERIEVMYSGQREQCPLCNSVVFGKKGEVKKKHWAHYKTKDCDTWFDPLTEWHLDWQNFFPIENREIVITKNGKMHRADIQLNNGMIIEVQNSPMPSKSILEREKFYGRKNMIWILNGKSLATHSEIKVINHPFLYYLIIEFPPTLPNNHEYLTKEFFDEVLIIYQFNDRGNMQLSSNKILFSSVTDNTNLSDLEIIQLKFSIVCSYQALYGHLDVEKFREGLKIHRRRKEVNRKEIIFHKKYWRSFVDKMSFPVFFDNLNGLDKGELYWYQMNKVVEKGRFLKKYMSYI